MNVRTLHAAMGRVCTGVNTRHGSRLPRPWDRSWVEPAASFIDGTRREGRGCIIGHVPRRRSPRAAACQQVPGDLARLEQSFGTVITPLLGYC
jgi:hypothetical protein